MTDILQQRTATSEVLEARFALKVASRLHEAANDLPHDIDQRLRFARERALATARRQTVAARSARGVLVSGLSASAAGLTRTPWWLRWASMVPLVMLVVGLVAIQDIRDQRKILAAAEIDTVLLTDVLPPAAYTDPGFAEFLKSPIP